MSSILDCWLIKELRKLTSYLLVFCYNLCRPKVWFFLVLDIWVLHLCYFDHLPPYLVWLWYSFTWFPSPIMFSVICTFAGFLKKLYIYFDKRCKISHFMNYYFIGILHKCTHRLWLMGFYATILKLQCISWGCRGCDRMVIRFTSTYAVSAYHH